MTTTLLSLCLINLQWQAVWVLEKSKGFSGEFINAHRLHLNPFAFEIAFDVFNTIDFKGEMAKALRFLETWPFWSAGKAEQFNLRSIWEL